jgi:membrane-associated phospholipid phosphatase
MRALRALPCLLLLISAAPLSAQQPVTDSTLLFFVTGTTAVALANDGWMRDQIHNPDSKFSNTLADVGNVFGDGRIVFPSLFVLAVSGKVLDKKGFYGVTSRALKSTLLAGAAALVFKSIVGRERPLVSPDDPYSFHLFRIKDNSFPSGHTTVAFALATSFARETPDKWTDAGFFLVASLTGWSRIQDDKHWTSDLVFGAGLGILSARFVHRVQRRLDISPAPGGFVGSFAF